MDDPVVQMSDTQPVQAVLHTLRAQTSLRQTLLEPKSDILMDHRKHNLIIRILEDKAHLSADFGQILARIEPIDQNLACFRQQETIDQPDQATFARPIGANDSDAMFGQRKINSRQDSTGIAANLNVFKLD